MTNVAINKTLFDSYPFSWLFTVSIAQSRRDTQNGRWTREKLDTIFFLLVVFMLNYPKQTRQIIAIYFCSVSCFFILSPQFYRAPKSSKKIKLLFVYVFTSLHFSLDRLVSARFCSISALPLRSFRPRNGGKTMKMCFVHGSVRKNICLVVCVCVLLFLIPAASRKPFISHLCAMLAIELFVANTCVCACTL